MDIENFIRDRELRGLSAATIRWYRLFLRQWETRHASDGDDPAATLRAWINTLSAQGGAAAYRAVRAYEFWREEQTNTRSWFRKCARWRFAPPPEYPVLRQAQFDAMMGYLDRSNRRDWRDFVAYNLLWYTGARLDAIRLLRPADVDLDGGTVVVSTKGGVRAAIALPDTARDILEEWLRGGHQGEPWVFPGKHEGQPVSASWLSHRLPALARLANVPGRVWVHGLRHAAATRIVAAAGVSVARRQLLHRSIVTTERYVHWDLSEVRRAVNQAFS